MFGRIIILEKRQTGWWETVNGGQDVVASGRLFINYFVRRA